MRTSPSTIYTYDDCQDEAPVSDTVTVIVIGDCIDADLDCEVDGDSRQSFCG